MEEDDMEEKRKAGRPKKETPQALANITYDIRPDMDLLHKRMNDLAMGQNEHTETIRQLTEAINYLLENRLPEQVKPEPIPEPVKPVEVKPVFQVAIPAETEKPRGFFGFGK